MILTQDAAIVADLEYPVCPLCQSERRTVSYPGSGQHEIMRCRDCNVHYLYPRLTEAAMRLHYIDDNYFAGGETGYSDAGYALQEKALSATFRRFMQTLKKRRLTGGSLLEIGCGYGYLLAEAKEFYDYRVGTEYSEQGTQLASAKADQVYQGGIEEVPANLKFDCIVATHVIEHVYQPLEFLKNLIGHSKPNGKIVLAAPDMGGLLRKVMGRRWPSFKFPEHVLYFDAATLGALMRQVGLKDIQTLPYPHAFPLALIASKFRLPVPSQIGNVNVWVPATTVALSGTVSFNEQ